MLLLLFFLFCRAVLEVRTRHDGEASEKQKQDESRNRKPRGIVTADGSG